MWKTDLSNTFAGWGKRCRSGLDENEHSSLSELKGRLSHKNYADLSAFESDQYVRALSTYEPLFLQRALSDRWDAQPKICALFPMRCVARR